MKHPSKSEETFESHVYKVGILEAHITYVADLTKFSRKTFQLVCKLS
jgi:hypothetical protein